MAYCDTLKIWKGNEIKKKSMTMIAKLKLTFKNYLFYFVKKRKKSILKTHGWKWDFKN